MSNDKIRYHYRYFQIAFLSYLGFMLFWIAWDFSTGYGLFVHERMLPGDFILMPLMLIILAFQGFVVMRPRSRKGAKS